MKNVRHDIEPQLIKDSVRKRVEYFKERFLIEHAQKTENYNKYINETKEKRKKWLRIPLSPEESKKELERIYNNFIFFEENKYAKVRVIERPIKDKPFILVYGDVDDNTVKTGTGGFDSFEDAQNWFLKSGR